MMMRSPPSGLPAIFPSRGEIGSFGLAIHSASEIDDEAKEEIAGRPGSASPIRGWETN